MFLDYLSFRFPLAHFGKLFGVGHLIGSAVGSIQYGLFVVAEDIFHKDPFWVSCDFRNSTVLIR